MESRTVLITGAAKRIGNELALHLAKQGWNLAIHYNSSKAEAMALRNYLKVIYPKQVFKVFCCDLSDKPESLISEVQKEFDQIDLLLNNASVYSPGSIKETSIELLDEQMSVNFKAPFILMRDYANLCKKGGIINFLDTRVTKFASNYAAYSLSKVALSHLTQMGALEFGPNIRVNGIAPGSTIAPLGADSDYLESRASRTPMKEPGGIQPILKTVDYILDNTYLTGQILYCDGGRAVAVVDGSWFICIEPIGLANNILQWSRCANLLIFISNTPFRLPTLSLLGKDYKNKFRLFNQHVVIVSPITGEMSEGQRGVQFLFVL